MTAFVRRTTRLVPLLVALQSVGWLLAIFPSHAPHIRWPYLAAGRQVFTRPSLLAFHGQLDL